jgi:hypothetical protein
MNNCTNTDISGIGVRTATYAQNLLSFLPAFWALVDRTVDESEKEALETQSTTILLSAFALLFSAIIQARTQGLDSYNTALVLNLSWMNNTNTFIYLLLLLHRNAWIDLPKKWAWRDIIRAMFNPGGQHGSYSLTKTPASLPGVIQCWLKRWGDPVILIGTLHLSLMGALGVWLWMDPGHFGDSSSCSPGSVSIFTHGVPVASRSLRILSLIVYFTALTPGFNLILPVCLIFTPYFLYLFWGWNSSISDIAKQETHTLDLNVTKRLDAAKGFAVSCVGMGLMTLFVINILFIVDTELSIAHNEGLQQDQNGIWTFGQTLALMLLVLPLRDAMETILQRRRQVLDQRDAENNMKLYQDTVPWDAVEKWIKLIGAKKGAEELFCRLFATLTPIQVDIHQLWLRRASAQNRLEIVQFLITRGADARDLGLVLCR